MEALKTSLQLVQQNKMTPLQFEDIFFPAGSMQFFLSYNYDNPEVAGLLREIQKAGISEAVANGIPYYISGQRKQMDMALRREHPEINKPVPMLSGGWAPPDQAPSITPDPTSSSVWLSKEIASGKSVKSLLAPQLAAFDSAHGISPQPSPALQTKPSSSGDWFVPVLLAVGVIIVVVVAGVFFVRRKSS